MKLKMITFQHEARLSLYVVPETDEERQVLRMLWKFGQLESTNGVADGSGQGFAVAVREEPSLNEVDAN